MSMHVGPIGLSLCACIALMHTHSYIDDGLPFAYEEAGLVSTTHGIVTQP